MSIAEFVKERRKKLGMTQVVLADRAGVGLRFLRELEQGKTNLRLDKVNQVLQMFGNTVSVGLMDRIIAVPAWSRPASAATSTRSGSGRR